MFSSEEQPGNVLGIIGSLISLVMFLCPVWTFVEIWRRRSVEEFSPVPYLATLLNCMIWAFYGIPVVHKNSILVAATDFVGAVIELIYIFIFIAFSPNPMRLKVVRMLILEVLLMAVVITGVMLGTESLDTRSRIVGVLSIIFGMIMYASHLPVMKVVTQTKSVRYMPLFPCLVGFLSSIWWTYCGFHPLINVFIIIPNVVGALLGVVQLIVYCRYSRSTPHDDDLQPDGASADDPHDDDQPDGTSSADVPPHDDDQPHGTSDDQPHGTSNDLPDGTSDDQPHGTSDDQPDGTSAGEPSTSDPISPPSS